MVNTKEESFNIIMLDALIAGLMSFFYFRFHTDWHLLIRISVSMLVVPLFYYISQVKYIGIVLRIICSVIWAVAADTLLGVEDGLSSNVIGRYALRILFFTIFMGIHLVSIERDRADKKIDTNSADVPPTQETTTSEPNISSTNNLFKGCQTKEQYEKRYHNLMKLYHPDNESGDTEMAQTISHTYKEIKKQNGWH